MNHLNGQILIGDVRQTLATIPANTVHCCVTSPPYYALRDYGVDGQIGLEKTPDAYIAEMVAVFREVRRVLHPSGTCFVNIGDSYNSGTSAKRKLSKNHGGNGYGKHGCWTEEAIENRVNVSHLKPKDMIGIPWMLAFALRNDGWYLRSEIIWHKRSHMPESTPDRPTKAHEPIFLLSKSQRYFWDNLASAEKAVCKTSKSGNALSKYDGKDEHRTKANLTQTTAVETRRMRSVWSLSSEPYKEAHFATYPSELVRRCLSAGISEKGCCPKCGEPFKRITKRDRIPTRTGNTSKVNAVQLADDSPYWDQSSITGNRDPKRHVTREVTTGWQPNCKCDTAPADALPCTVLDPFLGSGTTAQVAQHLGYRWIGCELNEKYVELAKERIAKKPRCLMPKKIKQSKPRKKNHAQKKLFQ